MDHEIRLIDKSVRLTSYNLILSSDIYVMQVMIIMNFSSGSEVNHTYQISLEIFSIDCCNTVTPREYQQLIFYWLL